MMTKEAWIAAKAELDAIEKERDSLLEPTRQRYESAEAKLDEIEEESPERIGTCEGCLKLMWKGESYSYDNESSLYFCERCSPSYDDMLADPTSFTDADGEPLTASKAQALVDAHVAAGGSLEDKMVSP